MGGDQVKLSGLHGYTRYHVTAFLLTFLVYCLFHASRKTFSNVKTTMLSEWTPSYDNGTLHSAQCPTRLWHSHNFFSDIHKAEEFMGTLDASFLFAYAVGLFLMGFVADRHDLRVMMTIGMAFTSLMVFAFGCLFEWLEWFNQPAYLITWILNGFSQSTAWPCVVAVMGNWFGRGSRGLVMGVWSACASVGNIIGALLVSEVLEYGYNYAFLVTAGLLLAGAVVIFFGLVPTPLEVGLPLPQDGDDNGDDVEVTAGDVTGNSLPLDELGVEMEQVAGKTGHLTLDSRDEGHVESAGNGHDDHLGPAISKDVMHNGVVMNGPNASRHHPVIMGNGNVETVHITDVDVGHFDHSNLDRAVSASTSNVNANMNPTTSANTTSINTSVNTTNSNTTTNANTTNINTNGNTTNVNTSTKAKPTEDPTSTTTTTTSKDTLTKAVPTEEANHTTATTPTPDNTSTKSTSVEDPTVIYDEDNATRPKAINFFMALLLPGVVPYALCYAFLKLVNYSFFFWLPFYLSNAYNMAESVAGRLSIWYDLGGVFGGMVAGFVSDRLGARTLVVVPMLVIAVPMLCVYGLLDLAGTMLSNGALLFALGCLIGGVSNVISAAISADLGRHKVLKGNSEALSTVTGILDGTGSLGAALGQVAVPHLQLHFGWRSVFYLFMVCTFLTTVCVFRIFCWELKTLCCKSRRS